MGHTTNVRMGLNLKLAGLAREYALGFFTEPSPHDSFSPSRWCQRWTKPEVRCRSGWGRGSPPSTGWTSSSAPSSPSIRVFRGLFFGESRKRMSQPRSARWHDSNWIRDLWAKSQTFLSLLRLQLLARVEKMLNVNNSCSNAPSQTKLIFSQPKNGRVSKICTYLVCEL